MGGPDTGLRQTIAPHAQTGVTSFLTPLKEFELTQIFPESMRDNQSPSIIGYSIVGIDGGAMPEKMAKLQLYFYTDSDAPDVQRGKVANWIDRRKTIAQQRAWQRDTSKETGLAVLHGRSYHYQTEQWEFDPKNGYEFVRSNMLQRAVHPWRVLLHAGEDGSVSEGIKTDPLSCPAFEQIKASEILQKDALALMAADVEGALQVLTKKLPEASLTDAAMSAKTWTKHINPEPHSREQGR